MDTSTYVIIVCIHTTNKIIIIITKNKKVLINTTKHRNNTNSIFKASQKEYHIIIDRKYYTFNHKVILRCSKNSNKNKHTMKKITIRNLIKKYQNIKNNKINKIHNHNIKTKNKYKTNISLNKWNVVYNHETKNTTIWQECQKNQLYRTKYWHNHQTSKKKKKFYKF